MPAIKFYENIPETTFDAHGVRGVSCSGNKANHWRCRRSTYRKFLETEIRRLNDYETEERRLAMGKILPLKAAGGH